MQITITIPDEVASQAESRGLKPETYVEALVAKQFSPKWQSENVTARLQDLETFFEEMAVHSAKIANLPDEAFTRESFYLDRE